ncbi:MAG: cytochrome C [Pseudomonadota bacterium]
MSGLAFLLWLAAQPANQSGDCSACHTTTRWTDVQFDHEQTRLPLRGRHQGIPCRACHANATHLRLDPVCSSCHVDVHAGSLGRECARCHDSDDFRQGDGVRAHARSRFPLYGRHAVIPCDACHRQRADRAMGGLSARCKDCHAQDLLRTRGRSIDHQQAGVGEDCARCHSATRWTLAVFPDHDRCFPIAAGAHRGIACQNCHSGPVSLAVNACASFTADCTRCHRCSTMDRRHQSEGVAGYQCAQRKCYECHPHGEEGR